MERALAETDRRRDLQKAHNEKHNITPVGITKQVTDILDVTYKPKGDNRYPDKVAEDDAEYTSASAKDFSKRLNELEDEMFNHAQYLEFEKAAKLRDRIRRLQAQMLLLPQ